MHLRGPPPTRAGLWAFVSPSASALCSPPSGAPPRFLVHRRPRSGLPRAQGAGAPQRHPEGPPAPATLRFCPELLCARGRASRVRPADSRLPRTASPSRLRSSRVFPAAGPPDHHRAPSPRPRCGAPCRVRSGGRRTRVGAPPRLPPRGPRAGGRPSPLLACASARRSPGGAALADMWRLAQNCSRRELTGHSRNGCHNFSAHIIWGAKRHVICASFTRRGRGLRANPPSLRGRGLTGQRDWKALLSNGGVAVGNVRASSGGGGAVRGTVLPGGWILGPSPHPTACVNSTNGCLHLQLEAV